jgi:hypothetical protein
LLDNLKTKERLGLALDVLLALKVLQQRLKPPAATEEPRHPEHTKAVW